VDGNLGVANVLEGVLIEQPTTDEERAEAAQFCTAALDVSLPTILDKIDDRVANAYAAFPDRIYIIGADGRVSYKGRPGPAGFDVPEAMAALEVAMAGGTTPYGQEPGRQTFGRGARGARGQFAGRRDAGEGLGVMDANGDGQISVAEWQGEQDAFDRFDANGNGFLTMDEIQGGAFGGRGRRGNPGSRLQAMDADSNGEITAEEFQGPAEMFGVLDSNLDGVLSGEELSAGTGARREGRGRGFGPSAARFQNMDADGNGQISSAEWPGPEQMFSTLDANGDGVLSSDEMLAGRGGRGPRP